MALAGTAAGNYTLSSTSATTTASINAITLTPVITVANKVYDRTPNATVTGCTVTGVLMGDTVNCVTTGSTASFADERVGTGKTVTVSGLGLQGGQAGNYALASPATTTASITAVTLTASVAAANKTYNRLPTATVANCTLSGVLAGDTVSCDTTGSSASFADEKAGTGKSVTVTGLALQGGQAGNYVLANPTLTTSANITAAVVTASATIAEKTYDGITNAVVQNCTVTGRIDPDQLGCTASAHFADPDAGNNKTVVVTGMTLTGTAAPNYSLTDPNAGTQPLLSFDTTGNIDPAIITPVVTVYDKVYDTTTTASVHTCELPGVVMGDDVSCTASAMFGTKAAGAGKPVSVTNITLAGNDAGNYALSTTSTTTSASITAATLTAMVTAASKAYDRQPATTVTGCTLGGVVRPDAGSCVT